LMMAPYQIRMLQWIDPDTSEKQFVFVATTLLLQNECDFAILPKAGKKDSRCFFNRASNDSCFRYVSAVVLIVSDSNRIRIVAKSFHTTRRDYRTATRSPERRRYRDGVQIRIARKQAANRRCHKLCQNGSIGPLPISFGAFPIRNSARVENGRIVSIFGPGDIFVGLGTILSFGRRGGWRRWCRRRRRLNFSNGRTKKDIGILVVTLEVQERRIYWFLYGGCCYTEPNVTRPRETSTNTPQYSYSKRNRAIRSASQTQSTLATFQPKPRKNIVLCASRNDRFIQPRKGVGNLAYCSGIASNIRESLSGSQAARRTIDILESTTINGWKRWCGHGYRR